MKPIPFIDLTSNILQPELQSLQLLRFEVAARDAASNINVGNQKDVKCAMLILNTIQHIIRSKNQFSEVNNETVVKLKSLSITLKKKLIRSTRNEENDKKVVAVDSHDDVDCGMMVEDSISSQNSSSADVTLVNNNSKSNKTFEAAKATSNNKPSAPFFSDTISAENIQTLLLDQRISSAKELESEQRTQMTLLKDLTELTGILKDSTMQISRSVVEQNEQLSSIQLHAEENKEKLDNQRKQLNERSKKMESSLWNSMSLIVAVLLLFALTYIVIRLLPNRETDFTCRNSSRAKSRAASGHNEF